MDSATFNALSFPVRLGGVLTHGGPLRVLRAAQVLLIGHTVWLISAESPCNSREVLSYFEYCKKLYPK